MKKVLIIGNFGAKNLGDELILATTLQNNRNVVVMTVDANFSQKFVGRSLSTTIFFPSGIRSFGEFFFKKKVRKKIYALKKENFEKIVFPGGGLFAIKTKAVFLWTVIFLWAKYFLKKPVYFESAGVDAEMSFLARTLTKFVFRRVDFVSARDEKSAKFLSEICGKKIENVGDAAENFIKNKILQSKNIKQKEKILCLNARASFDFTSVLDNTKFKDYAKYFVAFDPSDMKFVPENIEVIFPQTMEDLIALFLTTELAIGERLHFLIVSSLFCGSNKVFVPRQPYAEKVENFCKEKGIRVFGN